MATQEVTLSDLGGADEGELVAWLVDVDERVDADQSLAEVETDKSLVEVPAPATGVVTELRAVAGETVRTGDVLAVMDVEESAPAEPESAASETRAAPDEAGSETPVPERRVFAPPRVRRLAREEGVDLAAVDGSGPGGRITEDDVRERAEAVRAAAEASGPRTFTGGKSAVSEAGEEPSPRTVTGGKSVVSKRSSEKASASESGSEPEPVSTPAIHERAPAGAGEVERSVHHDEADVTDLLSLRDRLAPEVEFGGTTLTALPFAVATVAAVLSRLPAMNGPVVDGSLDQREQINVAIGVPTDDGLATPVVVDADDPGLGALSREVADLIDRARRDDLDPVETDDATFTVTDFGALGGTYAAPAVAAAGTSVLALGAIRSLPRVHDGEVVPRDVVALSTAVDARAVDGAVAARFTDEVRRYLQEPALNLL